MKRHCKLIAFIVLGSFSVAHSISEPLVYGLSAVTGCISGCASYKLSHGSWYVTIPVMGGVSYLGYKFFNQFTPAGRVERAKSVVADIRSRMFFNEDVVETDIIIDKIKMAYMTEWPLISAYNDFVGIVADAKVGIELAVLAQDEDVLLAEVSNDIVDELSVVIGKIAAIIKIVRDSAEYIKQLELYKEEKRREKELVVMQSQANAQWHQANASYAQAPKRND